MINANNISFSYRDKHVLEYINLKLEEGKIYGLLGENGVGKTTLLTLLCGLKEPYYGFIRCDGMDPSERKPEFLESQYYLPDEVAPVNTTAIDFARTQGKFWPRFNLQKFEDLMKLFEADVNQRMTKMSAGQLKKVYICFALASEAKYLYLDEPTNALDIPSKSRFRTAITEYSRPDAVIVISTHQVRDLDGVIDPIVILDSKEVLLNASIKEITDRLYFDYGTELRSGILHVENVPGGFVQVFQNAEGRESKLDIETLFNAVLCNKGLVKNLFSR